VARRGQRSAAIELAAGALSALGCVLLVLLRDSTVAFSGAVISASAITALFLGSESRKIMLAPRCLFRIFLPALIAIYLLAQG
jgi:hypothetical protein